MLDGQTVQGLTLNEAVDKMRGTPGSSIRLTIKREGVNTPVEIVDEPRGHQDPGGEVAVGW